MTEPTATTKLILFDDSHVVVHPGAKTDFVSIYDHIK
jgi:hypothetical protein